MANPIDGSGRPAGNPLQEARGNRQVQQQVDTSRDNDTQDNDTREASSGESERLQSVREAIDRTPEVDRERVDALREQIANGEYPLNAESIADRFAELEGLLES